MPVAKARICEPRTGLLKAGGTYIPPRLREGAEQMMEGLREM